MPYSDNNPERRNLTVLSLAIIVYYLAGGQFLDGKVNLMLINATFTNPSMLIAIVWVMLCWFLFRYIVTNKQQDSHAMHQTATITNMNNYLTRQYLDKHSETPLIAHLNNTKIYFNTNNKWTMRFDPIDGTRGELNSELNGILGYLVKTLYMIKIALKNRLITDYYTPYLLFLWAVGLGIYNYYWKSQC